MASACLLIVLGVLVWGDPCMGRAVTVLTPVGKIAGASEQLVVNGRPFGISRFLSIPYAETTGGQNRFRKPIQKAPFTDIFNATQLPMGCYPGHQVSTTAYGMFLNFTEDCLILNVYVPHMFERNASLPVMVWIHGGAFVEGAAAIYPGEGIATLGNVILVTINYRLGMFGFIRSASGDLPGNQGLWDQHLAIKWVHNNIAAFTGNPDDVTIIGESAGAASVIFQTLYAGNRGLFRRVIAQSGSPLAYWTIHNGPNADALMKKKSCGGSPDPASCLRALAPEVLQDEDTSPWLPIVDNDFLVADPKDIVFGNDPSTAAARNLFSSVDFLTGINDFDGAIQITSIWPSILGYTNIDNFTLTQEKFSKVVVPITVSAAQPSVNNETADVLGRLMDFMYTDWSRPDDSDAVRNALVDLSNDVPFFAPAMSTVEGHASLGGARTFLYQFSVAPTTHTLETPSWITGPNHADEIQYVFGYPLYSATPTSIMNTGHYTDQERLVADALVTMDPNKPMNVPWYTNTTWPEYDIKSRAYMQLSGDGATAGSRFAARRMEFWQHLFPAVANTYDCHPHAQGPNVPILVGK
ncbi:CEL-like protein [Mya arenaria]|uniref:CEL-like protein n=1 Tax=Mya arenaria TaxID=6604 RepID=A0ABY7DBS4_MYAAR|nr:CEL-like protein [Mya arenaria]